MPGQFRITITFLCSHTARERRSGSTYSLLVHFVTHHSGAGMPRRASYTCTNLHAHLSHTSTLAELSRFTGTAGPIWLPDTIAHTVSASRLVNRSSICAPQLTIGIVQCSVDMTVPCKSVRNQAHHAGQTVVWTDQASAYLQATASRAASRPRVDDHCLASPCAISHIQ